MKFKEFNLLENILSAIEQAGYTEATTIQELAIPVILQEKDVIGLAQTGTGKTAAFALPMINQLLEKTEADKRIKALILSPTRELAIQIRDNIVTYAKNTSFKCSVILGGVNQQSQINVLNKGVDILVATPGRLVDLINQKKADLSHVQYLVLDEADTMLDMGFIKDIRFLINKTPKQRQTLLFSATMPKEVVELSKEFMNNPVTIKTKEEGLTVDKIKQELYYVDKPNKFNLLLDAISQKENPTMIIFTRTKHGANDLEKKLNGYDIKTSVIHGNKTQSNRVKAISDFKLGKTKILIATDIAARGIDINDLGLVINYDIPEKPEIYVHRIGRTARAGKEGRSMAFCSSAELLDMKNIEKLIGRTIAIIDHKYPMVLQEKKPVPGANRMNHKKSIDRDKKIDSSLKKPDKNKKYNTASKNTDHYKKMESTSNSTSNNWKSNSSNKNQSYYKKIESTSNSTSNNRKSNSSNNNQSYYKKMESTSNSTSNNRKSNSSNNNQSYYKRGTSSNKSNGSRNYQSKNKY